MTARDYFEEKAKEFHSWRVVNWLEAGIEHELARNKKLRKIVRKAKSRIKFTRSADNRLDT